MTILGKFTKQPREIEIYGFQFSEDMTETDEVTSGYCALMIGTRPVVEIEPTGVYTALLSDDGSLVYAVANVNMPVGAPVGYKLAVANTQQNASILVGGITVPARGAIIAAVVTGGVVVAEMAADCILISLPGDQRLRLRIAGGLDKLKYKAQATANTAEGRIMEDEMILSIKED